jgi:hypothetical protein
MRIIIFLLLTNNCDYEGKICFVVSPGGSPWVV